MAVSKPSRVSNSSLRRELRKCAVLIFGTTLVALVEAPDSTVFPPSSSITRGSSERSQSKGVDTAQKGTGGLTLTVARPIRST